jgi:hypothetical protein
MNTRLAAAAIGGVLVLSLTACQEEKGGRSRDTGGAVQLSAAQVLAKASDQADRTDSFRQRTTTEGDLSVQGQKFKTRTEMDLRIRMKPDLAMVGTMTQSGTTPGGGGLPGLSRAPMEMIMVGDAMYMKTGTPGLAGGKPWAKMPLGGGASGGGDLLKQSKENGPGERTRQLTGAKDLREIGKETVDGVATTHYRGTVPVAGDRMTVDVWVDSENRPRKQTTNGVIKSLGGKLTSTSYFSEYGKPFKVSVPPADQVGELDMPKIPGGGVPSVPSVPPPPAPTPGA